MISAVTKRCKRRQGRGWPPATNGTDGELTTEHDCPRRCFSPLSANGADGVSLASLPSVTTSGSSTPRRQGSTEGAEGQRGVPQQKETLSDIAQATLQRIRQR